MKDAVGPYKVYHNKNFLQYYHGDSAASLDVDPSELVATVAGDSLEGAYLNTNNIDTNWTDNSNVVYHGKEDSCRSTSTGDYIVDANGNVFMCCEIGWKHVNIDPEECKFCQGTGKSRYGPLCRFCNGSGKEK